MWQVFKMNQDEPDSTIRQPLVVSRSDDPSVSRSSVASARSDSPNWIKVTVAFTGMFMET